jgi:four helix bundle protein
MKDFELCGHGSDADLARFLQTTFGSASEVKCPLLLSHDLGLMSDANYKQLDLVVTEVKRMLGQLHQNPASRKLRVEC